MNTHNYSGEAAMFHCNPVSLYPQRLSATRNHSLLVIPIRSEAERRDPRSAGGAAKPSLNAKSR